MAYHVGVAVASWNPKAPARPGVRACRPHVQAPVSGGIFFLIFCLVPVNIRLPVTTLAHAHTIYSSVSSSSIDLYRCTVCSLRPSSQL